MSQTITAFDPREKLTSTLEMLAQMYVADLAHIPDDKLFASPMGVARTPGNFTAEVIGFNKLVEKTLRGETVAMLSEDERNAHMKSFDTREKLNEGIKASCADLASAVAQLDDDGLNAPATTPWGQPTTRFDFARMAAMHIMYHDGQINYIQSLYGDAENHWGEH